MAETYEELTSLTKEELIERHDSGVQRVVVGISHYEAELRHRETMEVLNEIAKGIGELSRRLSVVEGYFQREWDVQKRTGRFADGPPDTGKAGP